jgi:diaminopimelate decarboxylase
MALAAGATADRIAYGNTIKKEREIARAFALGVRLFAVDCRAEVEKVARAAPGWIKRPAESTDLLGRDIVGADHVAPELDLALEQRGRGFGRFLFGWV